MASKNDVTGDIIQTRVITDNYRNNYDLIFGKNKKDKPKLDNENDESGGSNTDNRQQTS